MRPVHPKLYEDGFYSIGELLSDYNVDLTDTLSLARRKKAHLCLPIPLTATFKDTNLRGYGKTQTVTGFTCHEIKHRNKIFIIHPDDLPTSKDERIDLAGLYLADYDDFISNGKPNFQQVTSSESLKNISISDLLIHKNELRSDLSLIPRKHELIQQHINQRRFNLEINIALDIFAYHWKVRMMSDDKEREICEDIYEDILKNCPNSELCRSALMSVTSVVDCLPPEFKAGNTVKPFRQPIIADVIGYLCFRRENTSGIEQKKIGGLLERQASIERINKLSKPDFLLPQQNGDGNKFDDYHNQLYNSTLTVSFFELPYPLRVAIQVYEELGKRELKKLKTDQLEGLLISRYKLEYTDFNARAIAQALRSEFF